MPSSNTVFPQLQKRKDYFSSSAEAGEIISEREYLPSASSLKTAKAELAIVGQSSLEVQVTKSA